MCNSILAPHQIFMKYIEVVLEIANCLLDNKFHFFVSLLATVKKVEAIAPPPPFCGPYCYKRN